MSLIDIDWKPNKKKLRQFGIIFSVGFSVFGLLAVWKTGALSGGSWLVPLILWCTAACVGILGFLFPPGIRPLYLLWMALAFPIGWVISNLFLVLIYYFVFSGIGLMLRIVGRDPLNRKRISKQNTFWVRKPGKIGGKRYFRQF